MKFSSRGVAGVFLSRFPSATQCDVDALAQLFDWWGEKSASLVIGLDDEGHEALLKKALSQSGVPKDIDAWARKLAKEVSQLND